MSVLGNARADRPHYRLQRTRRGRDSRIVAGRLRVGVEHHCDRGTGGLLTGWRGRALPETGWARGGLAAGWEGGTGPTGGSIEVEPSSGADFFVLGAAGSAERRSLADRLAALAALSGPTVVHR
jgi:hypothetical protein